MMMLLGCELETTLAGKRGLGRRAIGERLPDE
jgi:hypothetical protein